MKAVVRSYQMGSIYYFVKYLRQHRNYLQTGTVKVGEYEGEYEGEGEKLEVNGDEAIN